MIHVRGLVKAFGVHTALRGVDLDVEPGEFVSILGPNGAGKTTLLRILATLSKPTAGVVQVAGYDVQRAGPAVRRRIGLISHQTLLYPHLTAEENLRFYGRLYGLADSDLDARIDEMLAMVDLSARRHDPVRTYSRGMQQRLAIARAVLHRPSLVFFDEPYTGLDQRAAAILDGILQEVAAAGRTVLLTTHNIERALSRCHRVVILNRGKVVYRAPRSEIDPEAFPEVYEQVVSG
ncbi:MAG: heme ABC exporter ATP-binding protein CcmA [Chloroflexi bacterium]|nr:MAG: heme ABC exporter ATP-binding protein CcmA [Chloroflexota bacterium]